MRTTRALAASAAAVALVGIAAPTATAWDQPTSVTATPNVIARGGQLVLTVSGGDACGGTGSTISSDAFPTTNLRSVDGRTATATVRVNANASTGSHSVTTNCEGRTKTFTNVFTVIGGVRGGLGGSSSVGATPTDIAIGGGLVASAVIGGGVFWMRRRAENKI
ncbi:hypothetical protein Sipo8835_13420 [Streptomyces ipomoeae]|jgi:hypothetical protein|uniref:Integral membrane protein n=2 Tax=Streptomyces ipomoeae TaxID=103232 RepID=L1L122_9ACTN|nr:hypothetical protein [Streptomyces ipomoeae]EKX66504.1 hypothetical protein STRIP9103_08711 [Streptomyces ipomoeae 91-03]MDX2700014.1 hypothetical protein [Streptomyces ipomoeae]MDX2822254.1 hypothetical protein [Streptomyces ipomoeae]MDX2840596.1 hypothetical protein [Streptomyces ipomoeae]MDX2874779.1 hypothetical protein [Streptomyces ipomoeae]